MVMMVVVAIWRGFVLDCVRLVCVYKRLKLVGLPTPTLITRVDEHSGKRTSTAPGHQLLLMPATGVQLARPPRNQRMMDM